MQKQHRFSMQSKVRNGSEEKSKIKYYKSSQLREYKMYKQILHDSILSEQSSDIVPSHESNFDTTFKSAQEEISGVSLYDDLPQKLLKQPETDPNQVQLLFGRQDGFALFDSVVVDAELADMEIEQLRKNKMLTQQIGRLYKIKYQKQLKLGELQNRRKVQARIKQQYAKIYSKLDLKTQRIIDHLKPDESGKTEEIIKYKQAVLELVNKQIQRYRQKSQIRLQQLRNKRELLRTKQQYLQRQISKIQPQIVQKREERRRQLIQQRIEAQKKYLLDLKSSINKMGKILGKQKK